MHGYDLEKVAQYIKTSKFSVLTRWDAVNYVSACYYRPATLHFNRFETIAA
jgi:hypothetical protein